MNYNKVILAGNLTREPTLTYLPSQTAVIDFGMAENRKYTTKVGEKREETCFVDCRAFGKVADNISKYFHKGDSIMVEGRLTFDQWEAQDGSKRSKHRITVQSFTFLGGGEREQQPRDRAEFEPQEPQKPDNEPLF